MSFPKLQGIDHIHLYVEDKNKSLDWYQRILGFEVVDPLLIWNSDNGPLTIQDSSHTIHLALFKRDQQPPCTSIAFKTNAENFLLWQQHLTEHKLNLRIADHQISWSLYFKDPDDNMHEITTEQYQQVKKLMVEQIEAIQE